MKLVRESLNEKFTDVSDPIKDMGIGLRHKIKEFMEEHMEIEQQTIFQKNKPPYVVNDDGTIDVNGHLSFLNTLKKELLSKFPDFIRFNKVDGFVDFGHHNLTTLKGCPKEVHGYFRCSSNKLTSLKYCPRVVYARNDRSGSFYPGKNPGKFTEADVKKYCKHIDGRIELE
jgi:hypothetical protein